MEGGAKGRGGGWKDGEHKPKGGGWREGKGSERKGRHSKKREIQEGRRDKRGVIFVTFSPVLSPPLPFTPGRKDAEETKIEPNE